MTQDNPIVDEVHRIREQMLAEYGGDLRAMIKDIERHVPDSIAAGHEMVAMPPRVSNPVPPTKKVG